MDTAWRSFPCRLSQLNLDIVLQCGQCFRWKKTENEVEGEWIGVAGKVVWILKQNEDCIQYKALKKTISNGKAKTEPTSSIELIDIGGITDTDCIKEDFDVLEGELFLRDYFQLDIDLPSFYKTWSETDQIFKNIAINFNGLRILRQDPVENLFSFICSQNNHISRISSMVEKLCTTYGEPLVKYENYSYYAFPLLSKLAGPKVEDKLRKLGFGYRAKFISQSAKYITKNHSEEWLHNLRKVSHKEAHKALVALSGVGAKVADCVCLMSLDKMDAVPVDTHVWQVAARDYLPHLKNYKSITDKAYQEIGDYFRELYGPYAGWATSVLFSADLRKFKELKERNSAVSDKKERPKKAPKRKNSSAECLAKESKKHTGKRSRKAL